MNEQQPINPEKNPTTPGTTPEPVIETNMPISEAPATRNVAMRNYAIATLVIALMGGGLWLVLESQGRVQTNFLGAVTERGPVATVNGVNISRASYNRNRDQVRDSALQQGVDISDPTVAAEINNQAIETLINTELLLQEVNRLGITVSEEDIQARYDGIVEQVGGTDLLATRMVELEITEAGLREDIETELLIQALFDQEANTESVEVTEEEIMQVFSQVAAEEGSEASLEDFREIIESNIRLSKEQALITEYIQSLRAQADVQIKI